MSRLFSTSSHLAKRLKWKIDTRTPVDWAVEFLKTLWSSSPNWPIKSTVQLSGASLMDSPHACVCVLNRFKRSGDPHPTGDDPLHVTVTAGRKNIKGKDRLTSAHVYPNGTVRFSDKRYGEVKVSTGKDAGAGGSSAEPAGSAGSAEVEWVWDAAENKYRYWNGTEWIWQ